MNRTNARGLRGIGQAGFRVFLAGWSLLFLSSAVWLATHKSADAEILGRYSPAYATLLAAVAGLALISVGAHFGPVYRHLLKAGDRIILLFFSILIGLVAAEVATRILDPLGVSYFEETNRYHLDKMPDPTLVYKHRPGLRRSYQGVEVSINELGLRDRVLTEKRKDELRLLMLGDSITFGWGVPVEQTFSRRLEEILSRKLGRDVRTVNAGVGSYNTVQEYAFLKEYADTIEPDFVSLLFNSNDIHPNRPPFDPWAKRSLRGKTPPQTIYLLLKRSWLCRLLIVFPQAVIAYAHEGDAGSANRHSPGWKESMESIRAMARFCRERKTGLVVFFYQGVGDMSPLDEALLAEITEIGGKMDFPVIVVKPWDAATGRSRVANSTIDAHPNAQGHAIIAAGMADHIMENLPAPDRKKGVHSAAP